ncbi:DUF6173 family protein [Jannaschia sp. KMU-145]|uniref:DUF6173 family protein n=1 Tax=Jannaschia halovivens TaxID=3388667 RepID=UPI00396B0698
MTDAPDIATSAEAMEADALPRCAEPHADGTDHAPAMPEAVARGAKARSPAEWAYQRVILYLKAFEEELDDDHEVAMGFTGGATGILRIQGIGFHAPDLLTFSGLDEHGHRCQLIQHVSQTGVLLRAVPKPRDRPKPERIGFRLARALETDETPPTPRDTEPATG